VLPSPIVRSRDCTAGNPAEHWLTYVPFSPTRMIPISTKIAARTTVYFGNSLLVSAIHFRALSSELMTFPRVVRPNLRLFHGTLLASASGACRPSNRRSSARRVRGLPRDGSSRRFLPVAVTTAFSRLPPVHRADLEGRQRVEHAYSPSRPGMMGWTAPRTASACQDGRCRNLI
jgi:hypothetical protein